MKRIWKEEVTLLAHSRHIPSAAAISGPESREILPLEDLGGQVTLADDVAITGSGEAPEQSLKVILQIAGNISWKGLAGTVMRCPCSSTRPAQQSSCIGETLDKACLLVEGLEV